MTSSETLTGGVAPRPVVGRLPRYAAGKPPRRRRRTGQLQTVLQRESTAAAAGRPGRHCTADRFQPLPGSAQQQAPGGASRNSCSVPAEDIVTGAGSLGALNQLLATFAGRNDDGKADEVVYAWRSFEAYPISVGLSGAESVRIPVTADGRHDLEAMAAAVTARTRMVLLCTPNNPTGPALTSAETEAFIRRCPPTWWWSLMRPTRSSSGPEARWTASPSTANTRTWWCCGRSRRLTAWPGCRVGYSVSNPALTQHLRVAATPFAVSQIAETAAIVSLQNFGQVVERVQSLVDERDASHGGPA